jgi:glutamyl-tRNA synthetase
MKNLEIKTRAYALKNSLAYNGKCSQGSVISALFNEGLKKNEIGKFIKKISEIINDVNSLSLEEQKKEFGNLKNEISEREVREGLPELPDVKKSGVIMRFSPSPSGRLHIGHIRTACLSFLYVKKYGGKFYIRIEDTNPENIDKSSYKMIEKELKWLFGNSFEVVIQSNRMIFYYKYAEKLIKKNNAYICTCSGDEFREFSKKKKNCPCRKLNVKDNIKRWEKMLDVKGYNEGEAVLRFKSNMKNKNPAMRDFPLARINNTKHPLQNKKYRVWPLMNLSVTVDDIEMKMTHIIRGKDHRDNAERQKMIYKILGKKYPWSAFIGRYKFNDFDLSKTKIAQGIKSGKYSGWDDEKLATLAALKKKYNPEVFWKFTEKIGLSEVDKILNQKEFFELLNTFN